MKKSLNLDKQIFTAQWKMEYGMSFKTAAVFQTLSSTMRFVTNVVAACKFKFPTKTKKNQKLFQDNFDSLSPASWVRISMCFSVLAYSALLAGYFIEKSYFFYMTLLFGLFTGCASGTGYVVVGKSRNTSKRTFL